MQATDITESFGQGVWQQEAVEVARGAAESVPASAHVVMLVMLIAGLVMLLVGRKFLKTVFVGAGAAGAMTLGYFGPASLGLSVDPLIMAIVLGVIGALVGWAAFRMTVAAVLGVVFAMGGPVFTASFTGVDMHPAQVEQAVGALEPSELLLEDVPLDVFESGEAAGGEGAVKEAAAARVRVFVRGFTDEFARYWNGLPQSTRMTLFWSSVVGGLLGIAIGLVLPKRAAAVVTSVLGAGMVLLAGSWFLFSNGIHLPGSSPESGGVPSPRVVAVAWAVLAAVGIGMQWTKKVARADNDD